MTCPNCGKKMKRSIQDYLYTESGLDNIVLEKTEVYKCPCGEHMPIIKDIAGLHKTIALELAMHPLPLTGPMFRVLRKHMGLSASDVARMLDVSKVTVSRWENEASPIGEANERLFRMICIQTLQEQCGEVFAGIADRLSTFGKAATGAKRPRRIVVHEAEIKQFCQRAGSPGHSKS